MEKKETQVIIGSDSDIVYSSFYIQGLCRLFGKRNVRFGRIEGKPAQSGSLSFVLYREGRQERKYAISLADSYKVDESLYDWCDAYGSVNANFAKTPEQFHGKLVALCPSFGVRLWSQPRALLYALSDADKDMSIKKRLGKALRMLHRPTYEDYSPSAVSDRCVFFLSTLWYNDEWNKNDEGVNARRASFIRACRELNGEVNFEGGLVSQGRERSSEALFADCLCESVPMKEWLEKTKRSVLVFNTPAFWDCHGWKLGEYLAMGKCIVSTKLSNDLPVPLEHGKNIHFVENSQEAMKESVKYIIDHPEYRMMLEQGARSYWEAYGTPVASLRLLGIER